MRKSILWLCVILVLCTLPLCGCTATKEETGLPDKLKEEITQALIGKWKLIEEEGKLYPVGYSVTFKEDGEVHTFVSGYSSDGVYSVEKDVVHVTYHGAATISVNFKYTYENRILRLWDSGYEMERISAE